MELNSYATSSTLIFVSNNNKMKNAEVVKLHTQYSSTPSDIPNIKPKSTWEPQENHHTINTFMEALNNDVN